jgi:hypothetical protein
MTTPEPTQLEILERMSQAVRDLSACLAMKKAGIRDRGPDPIEAWVRELVVPCDEFVRLRDGEHAGGRQAHRAPVPSLTHNPWGRGENLDG